jgi:hypothetical protein
MNIEQIKREGYRLGLESELGVQQRSLETLIKEGQYKKARVVNLNIHNLLFELAELTKPQADEPVPPTPPNPA